MPKPEGLPLFSNQDSSPFRDQLKPLIPYEDMTMAHIMRLEGQPDKVVRISLRDNVGHSPDREVPWLLNQLQTGDRLLDDLESQYGIAVVEHAHVIASSPDDPDRITPYTVADRVLGDTLRQELEKATPGVQQEDVESLYLALINYHYGVLTSGGEYLSDISRNNGQYMVGPTAKNSNSRIYLTDIDPLIREYDPLDPSASQSRDIYRSIGALAGCIGKAEALTGWDMDTVKALYFEKLNVVPEASEFRHWVDDLENSWSG